MKDDKSNAPEGMEEESFADLFERSYRQTGRIEPGQKVEVRVLKISGDWVFLDTGRKGEGVLDRRELCDPEGNLTVKEGDTVTAYFLGIQNNELRFTTRIGGGAAGLAQLEEAYRAGIPVEGFVEKEVKGGFEVKLAGTIRSFCPYSQMDIRRVDAPSDLIGRHFPFRVTDYGERGRNIVVSRRALLEEEQRRQKEALRETLKEGMTVRGTVSSLQKFGAFVSLGGVEGLIPMAELGWGRVNDVRDVLSAGQEVDVVVKQIDWANDRITLSLKETLADPWIEVAARFPEGSYHTGRISRLAPFGAFVTIGEGIDGLIHISKLGGGKRINHPREIVKEGDSVEVKVDAVDREQKRLSLSLAAASREEEEEAMTLDRFKRQASEAPKTMGTLGDLLKAKMGKDKKS
ncbi:30S ribosomal protein S1 [Geobacter sp. DSM 9736]|uniref:30S ribosomal protein S1 n=1 Tax=Geobacter sp. DSM 9736 TaxID=1277350 RepID=UPI000B4FD91E|nr:30S ribosomal protein S1 [Geobacter sp. DSM 9736]SNB46927.1 small subunit ribosomal protein S1 [Geobacter sp. DSM 9736]